jgi:hypothetical protein
MESPADATISIRGLRLAFGLFWSRTSVLSGDYFADACAPDRDLEWRELAR